jgi:tetratricopeptide (TPR) repeat protein
MNRFVRFVVLCGALSPALAPQTGLRPQAPLPGGCVAGPVACYNRLVEAYASGNVEGSVGLLRQWDPRVYPDVAKACDKGLDKNDPWDARRYAAAVMMHTDAAFQISRQAAGQTSFLHLDVATQHLARGRAFKRAGVQEWARRWYVAVARCLRDRNAPYQAQKLLQLGRERLPQDAVVLAESGSLDELIATFYAIDVNRPLVHRDWGTDISGFIPRRVFEARTGNLNTALKWLRQSLSLDAENEETRLHLGRVLAVRFEEEEALRVLGEVADSKVDANAYLARLFMAGVLQRLGRLDEAAESYRAAIARWPRAHAPYVGLSEVVQRAGKGDESRQVLARLLAIDQPDDPYWRYQFDDTDVSDRQLDAMRDEVRR